MRYVSTFVNSAEVVWVPGADAPHPDVQAVPKRVGTDTAAEETHDTRRGRGERQRGEREVSEWGERLRDRIDSDTLQYGRTPPFRPWESDSTGMVHVLWSAKHRGLTLENDCDEIARMVMQSRWLMAVQAHAVADPPSWAKPTTEDPA